MSALIVVVGSLNRDHVLLVPHLPGSGETVLAESSVSHRGGKGANQAVAAARLGAEVALIGRVGADNEGTAYLRALVAEGIDVEGVAVDIDAPTGQAFVSVDPDAENSIIVLPGANSRLTGADVSQSSAVLERSAVLLTQLEVPLEAVKAAAQLAGGTVILNPAPPQPLGAQLLAWVDVLVPNRAELAHLTNDAEASDLDAVVAQSRRVSGEGLAVVATLGADGAVLVQDDQPVHIPAPEVDPVDTTGAGDAFCGALAEALARGQSMEEAVRWAVTVGAVATTRLGAQSGLPARDEVTGMVA